MLKDLDLVIPDYNSNPHRCKLSNLLLQNLSCARGASELLSYVDTSQLSKLELYLCQHVDEFLKTLSHCLLPNSTHLTRCNITLPWDVANPEQTVRTIERFLKSRVGMTHLHIDVSQHRMISKECLIHHADTLLTFAISTGQLKQSGYYSSQDLGHILTQCVKVRGVAINLPPAPLVSIWGTDAKFRLGRGQDDAYHIQSELEATLLVLAQHKSMHTLRMFNYPNITYWVPLTPNTIHEHPMSDDEAKLCQPVMQNFSNQVMQFMAKAGSSLRVFSVDPAMTESDCDLPSADSNGHRWPCYGYRRSRAFDAWGREYVVAAPLAKYKAEEPDSVRLHY